MNGSTCTGGFMPSASCPVCGKGFKIRADEAVLYEPITCPECAALLEVIEEDPIILAEAEF